MQILVSPRARLALAVGADPNEAMRLLRFCQFLLFGRRWLLLLTSHRIGTRGVYSSSRYCWSGKSGDRVLNGGGAWW